MTESTTSPSPLPLPPTFAFEPSHAELSGPAFSPFFKALAWGISLALLVWMLRLQLAWGHSATTWAWAAWVLVTLTAWTVQRSRLHILADRIEQDWLWRKQTATAELATLKLIRVRGLEWLLAPRAYARTLQGKPAVYYCADPVLQAELERMAAELTLWRQRLMGRQ